MCASGHEIPASGFVAGAPTPAQDPRSLCCLPAGGSGAGEWRSVYPHERCLLPRPVPPSIERGTSDSTVLSSIPLGLVTMECPARGSPPLQISWLKDGLPLPLSHRVSLLSAGRALR